MSIFLIDHFFVYLLYMKKVTLILALGVALTLTACGSGSTTPETNDSTVATVDSAAVVSTDSTTTSVEGGGSAKENAEKPVSGEAIK